MACESTNTFINPCILLQTITGLILILGTKKAFEFRYSASTDSNAADYHSKYLRF